jgi:hypothetical protein
MTFRQIQQPFQMHVRNGCQILYKNEVQQRFNQAVTANYHLSNVRNSGKKLRLCKHISPAQYLLLDSNPDLMPEPLCLICLTLCGYLKFYNTKPQLRRSGQLYGRYVLRNQVQSTKDPASWLSNYCSRLPVQHPLKGYSLTLRQYRSSLETD